MSENPTMIPLTDEDILVLAMTVPHTHLEDLLAATDPFFWIADEAETADDTDHLLNFNGFFGLLVSRAFRKPRWIGAPVPDGAVYMNFNASNFARSNHMNFYKVRDVAKTTKLTRATWLGTIE